MKPILKTMEKYNNRREMRRVGGKFAKPKTLEQQGYAINTGERTCKNCGDKGFPILTTWHCNKCDTTNT